MPEKIVLDNGVRLLIDPISTCESVSIGVWLSLGSRDEMENEHGNAHFTEHMVFKGTHRRSSRDIAFEIDSIGGEINGSTGKECTYYYVNAASEHYKTTIDILIDMFSNPSFKKEEFEKERFVILDEITMSMDDPEDYVGELFSTTLWGNHPFGLPVIGKQKDVRSVTLEEIVKFYGKHYSIDRMIISAAGKIDTDEFRRAVDKCFRSSGERKTLGFHENRRLKPDPRSEARTVQRDIEHVHFMCGTEGYSLRDGRRYSLILLNLIVGNSFSSRLFQKVREKKGLCYSISSGFSSYSNVGEFIISFSTTTGKLPRVLEEINHELHLLKEGDLKDNELEHAKRKFHGNYVLVSESVEWKMVKMALQEMVYGRIIPHDETLEKINRVTLRDLNEAAQEVFREDRFSFASVGPDEQIRHLDGFRFQFS